MTRTLRKTIITAMLRISLRHFVVATPAASVDNLCIRRTA